MAILRLSGGCITSKKIMDAIERSDDIFLDDNVTINGDIDICKMDLPKIDIDRGKCTQSIEGVKNSLTIINSSIKIINCKIEGHVNFSNSWFLKSVDFRGTYFEKWIDFAGSRFAEDSYFAGVVFHDEEPTIFICATFYKEVYFDNASIKDFIANYSTFYSIASFWGTSFRNANFIKCKFYGKTRYIGANFNGYSTFDSTKFLNLPNFQPHTASIDFSNAIFNKGGHFAEAQFDKSVVFTWARFISENQFIDAAVFGGAKFRYRATFWEVLFDGVARFENTTFFDDADFKLSKFIDDAVFWDSRFYGHAKFLRVRFNEMASFRNATFWRNLILTGARGYEIHLEDAKFNGCSCILNSCSQISDEIRKLESLIACTWDDKCRFTKVQLWSKSCIMLDDSAITHLYIKWKNIKDHIAYDSAAYLALTKNLKDSGEFSDSDACYYQFREIEKNKKNLGISKITDMFEEFYIGYGSYPLKAIPASFIVICVFAIAYLLCNWTFDIQSIGTTLYNSTIIFTANSKGFSWNFSYLYVLSLFEGLLGWLLMALFLVTIGRYRNR
jgi:uncharacterized protein YjbI with pentapeptide repeats